MVGLTNSLAVKLGEFGIRVDSVHPYGTDTLTGDDVSMYTSSSPISARRRNAQSRTVTTTADEVDRARRIP